MKMNLISILLSLIKPASTPSGLRNLTGVKGLTGVKHKTMKKCLIVEDSSERIAVITALLYHCEISIAGSAEEGIALLRNNEYELVFLDHDFDGFKLTGSHLAETWAKEKADFKTQAPQIIIHSMNIAKAAIMANFLKSISPQLTRLPFKFINMNSLILEKVFE